jgi:ADP-heptose:LPS heptosyltransferase
MRQSESQTSQRPFAAPRPAEPVVSQLVAELGELTSELRSLEANDLEKAVDAFLRVPRSGTGFPAVRPNDCRRITYSFRDYLRAHRDRFQLGDPLIPPVFFEQLDRFAASDIRSYPNEMVQLDLVRIEALVLCGRNEAALALSAPMGERPYLFENDFFALSRLFELDTLARLNLGQHAEVNAVALGRLLLLVRVRPRQLRRLFRRFFPMLATSSIFSWQYSRAEWVVRSAARLCLAQRLRRGGAKLGLRVAAWPAVLAASWTLRYMAWRKWPLQLQVLDGSFVRRTQGRITLAGIRDWVRNRRATGPVLVTRAMGGLGDIVMMTPGLRALAERTGQPVHFATKRQFFPLLEHNPGIKLLDIDKVIDIQQFRRWVNLSLCPAARYESRVTPKIRRGRVELFAGAMGIKRQALDRYGWRPVCTLSAEQLQAKARYRAEFQRDGLPIIGVQPFSRESYRNYPMIFKAMQDLAGRARIVYFHSTAVPAEEHPNMIQVNGRPIAETLAAIAACDYFVSVDSAFLHVAAAFNIPALSIFGPIDGSMRTGHHPRSIVIGAPSGFVCAPCWRNEDTPCYLSGGQVSVCLSSIPMKEVVDGVVRLMHMYPQIAQAT